MLSEKINETKQGSQKNSEHASNLLKYISSPQNQNMNEKCIHYESFNCMSQDPDENILEFQNLCDSKIGYEQNNLISHWTISFSEGKPTIEEMRDAALSLLKRMGYTEEYMYSIGIQKDTDNIHIHIATCRINLNNGKLLKEGKGWWKNESKKWDFEYAKSKGWEVAEGIEKLATQGQNKKRNPKIRKGGLQFEKRTEQKCPQRIFIEKLEKIKPLLKKEMKWGDFHKILAKYGIVCELAEHGKRQDLKYFDGKNYEKPKDLGEFWSLNNLEKFFGKTFRKPRKIAYDMAEKSRERLQIKESLKQQENESQEDFLRRNLKHWQSQEENPYVLKQREYFLKRLDNSIFFEERKQNFKNLSAFCRKMKFQRHSPDELKKFVNLGFDLIAHEISAKYAKNVNELKEIKDSYQKLIIDNPENKNLIQNEINLLNKRINLLENGELPEKVESKEEDDRRLEESRNIQMILGELTEKSAEELTPEDLKFIHKFHKNFIPLTNEEIQEIRKNAEIDNKIRNDRSSYDNTPKTLTPAQVKALDARLEEENALEVKFLQKKKKNKVKLCALPLYIQFLEDKILKKEKFEFHRARKAQEKLEKQKQEALKMAQNQPIAVTKSKIQNNIQNEISVPKYQPLAPTL